MISEGTSRASLPYLAVIHHNHAAVCLYVAHITALWPSGPTGTFGNLEPRFDPSRKLALSALVRHTTLIISEPRHEYYHNYNHGDRKWGGLEM